MFLFSPRPRMLSISYWSSTQRPPPPPSLISAVVHTQCQDSGAHKNTQKQKSTIWTVTKPAKAKAAHHKELTRAELSLSPTSASSLNKPEEYQNWKIHISLFIGSIRPQTTLCEIQMHRSTPNSNSKTVKQGNDCPVLIKQQIKDKNSGWIFACRWFRSAFLRSVRSDRLQSQNSLVKPNNRLLDNWAFV